MTVLWCRLAGDGGSQQHLGAGVGAVRGHVHQQRRRRAARDRPVPRPLSARRRVETHHRRRHRLQQRVRAARFSGQARVTLEEGHVFV